MSERRPAMQFGLPPKKDHKPLIICSAVVALAIILSAVTPKDTSPDPSKNIPDRANTPTLVAQIKPTPALLKSEFPLNQSEKLVQPGEVAVFQTAVDGSKKALFSPASVPLNINTNIMVDGQVVKSLSDDPNCANAQFLSVPDKPGNSSFCYKLKVNPNEERNLIYENHQWAWEVPDAGKETKTVHTETFRLDAVIDSENFTRGIPALRAVGQTDNGKIVNLTVASGKLDISGQQYADMTKSHNEDGTPNSNNICKTANQINKINIEKIRYIPTNDAWKSYLKSLSAKDRNYVLSQPNETSGFDQYVRQIFINYFNRTGNPPNITPHFSELIYTPGGDCTHEVQKAVQLPPENRPKELNIGFGFYLDNYTEKDTQSDPNAQAQKFVEDTFILLDQTIKDGEQTLEALPSPLISKQIMRDKANIERVQIGLIPLLNIIWSGVGFLIYLPKKTRKLGAVILGLGSVIGFCNLSLSYAQKAIEMMLMVPQIAISLLSGAMAASQIKLLEKQAQRQ